MNNYIKPTTTVVAVKTQQMIATSQNFQGNGNYDDGSGITLGAKGNGGMLWDDDEE